VLQKRKIRRDLCTIHIFRVKVSRRLVQWLLSIFVTTGLMATVNAEPLLTPAEEGFLQRHWSEVIPLQGPPPADYSELERSLAPQQCGVCHLQQFKDWQTTLHSKAMGPGIYGQLVDMVESDPATARICWSCHAPLAEQQERLWVTSPEGGAWLDNEQFDVQLLHSGLVCAACHLRQQQIYGPVRSADPTVMGKIDQRLPHDGFTAESAFSKSAFCRGCHQFTDDGYALNGKLIENTYNEWLESEYPAKGVQCQSCHMPKRRHLWRGIHDKEMVKQGVSISVELPDQPLELGDLLTATIVVANTGVGHHFPTYLTPKVFVRAELLDAGGDLVEGSQQEAIIGREVTLDLSQELYDTRIPAGDSVAIGYQQVVAQAGLSLRVSVVVEPDHFYAQFYRSVLSGNSPSAKGRALLEEALKDAEASPFTLFETVEPLPSDDRQVGTAHPPDWNEEHIIWYNYADGIEQACSSGKPAMLFFYADWCPTCHAYKAIFRDATILEATRQFTMIRVNVDHNPDIDATYHLDGGYVPRIFPLNADGSLMQGLQRPAGNYQYFIAANDKSAFLKLMQRVVSQSKKAPALNHAQSCRVVDKG